MADITQTLVVAIVASILSVLGFLGLILVIALYWTNIARRIAPNRFIEPESEKSWPSSTGSSNTNSVLSSPSPAPATGASPATSARSSMLANPQAPPKAVVKG
ncbi:hypothetical protein GGR50DRAFT_696870 [Xylaria sp. CBS 124048]|nr:hypothetical protein GGR50DRAFT_696870 [Xylaria sp. CBS 124048]